MTSRSDAGRPLTDLYPHHRVAARARGARPRPPRRRRRGDRRLPARRVGPGRRRAAGARGQGGRPQRRLPAARPRGLRGVLRHAPASRAAASARSTGCPSSTASGSRETSLVAGPGLLPDGGDPRAGAAGACAAHRGRGHRRQVGRVGRGPGADGQDALRHRRRERDALRRRHPPPHARDRAGARRARRPDPGDLHAAPAAARPGRARVLLRRRPTATTSATWSRCTRRPTPTSRSSSWSTRPPGVRDVRETNICGVHVTVDPRTRKVLVFGAIDNLWKGTSSQAVQSLNLMFGLRRDGGPAVSEPFFRSRWVDVPDGVRRVDRHGLPQGFRAAGVAAGIKPSGTPGRGAAGVRRAGARRAPRASRARARGAARCWSRASARGWTRCGPWRSTRATPTRRPGGRGIDEAARMQGAAAMVGRATEDRVARLLDRRDRRASSTARRSCAGCWRRAQDAAPDGDGAFQRGDHDHRRCSRSARRSRSSCPADRAPRRPGQGRGHDPADLRDDAVLRADRRRAGAGDRRPAAGRVREALVRPHHGRRPALDQRHGDPDVLGRQRRGRRARVRGRAALRRRRSTRCCASWRIEIVRDGEGAKRIGRVVVRGGHGPNVERTARAVANSPLVKTALHGGDPNWGRIVQAVGAGAARHRAAAGRRRHRGRAGLRRPASAVDHDAAALAAGGRAATRSSTPSACRATGARPRSSSPTSATST